MNPGPTALPETLRPLFWDQEFSSLTWEADRDLIVRRVLQSGSWPAVRWLRAAMGDEVLRSWLEAHAGGRLSPRQLRYWELVLSLSPQEVQQWITQARNNPWERRVQP